MWGLILGPLKLLLAPEAPPKLLQQNMIQAINRCVKTSDDLPVSMLHLVQELLLENDAALKRLSVRQIFRLLCVSKLWREALSKFLTEGMSESHDAPFPARVQHRALPEDVDEGDGEEQSHRDANFPDIVDSNTLELYSHYEEEEEEEEEKWFIMVSYSQEECHSLAFSDKEGILFRPPFHTITYNDSDSVWTEHLGWSTWTLGKLTSSHGLMFAVVSSPLPTGSVSGLEYKLVVFNCFTGYFKVLLSKVSVNFHSIQVAFDQHDKSCFYILLSDLHDAHSFPGALSNGRYEFWLYDSVEESCEYVYRYSDEDRTMLADALDLLECDFFLYKTERTLFSNKLIHEFHAFSAVEKIWNVVYLNMEYWEEELKDRSLSCFNFLAFSKCNDRLLTCVAIDKKAKKGLPNVYTELKVCELHPVSTHRAIWVEVSNFCIPKPLPRKTEMKPKAFAEAGEFFCCSFEYKWQYVRGENDRELRPPPVIYDMVHNRWHSLPSSVWPGGTEFKSFNCLFVLKPWQAIRHVNHEDS